MLKHLLKEEWRIHSSLFGGKKFALFPIMVFLFAVIGFYSLEILPITSFEAQVGLHWFILFFGLNVGTIGFVSESGMKNVLGEINLILFSSRTLPVSRKNVLGNFLLKDIIYYFFWFILPVVFGNLVLTFSPFHILSVTFTYTLAFVLGFLTTFFFSTLYNTSRSLAGVTALILVSITGLYVLRHGLSVLPVFQLWIEPSKLNFLYSAIPIFIFAAVGFVLFGRGKPIKSRRKENAFKDLTKKMDALNAKNILDLKRSSGGIGKIFFSYTVLFVFVWLIINYFPFGDTVFRSPLLILATLFGVFPVSIYNWLNRYDSAGDYLYLPLVKEDVVEGKIRSYILLGPVSVVLVVLISFLIFGGTILELLHGLTIALIISLSMLSVVSKLTGLRPNTKLFNTSVFIKFMILGGAVISPFLVLSIVFESFLIWRNLMFVALYLLFGTINYIYLRKILG